MSNFSVYIQDEHGYEFLVKFDDWDYDPGQEGCTTGPYDRAVEPISSEVHLTDARVFLCTPDEEFELKDDDAWRIVERFREELEINLLKEIEDPSNDI